MGAAAQVEEVAGPVHADLVAFDLVIDQLDLVVLAELAKLVEGLLAGHDLFDEGPGLLRDPPHSRLDGAEVRFGDRFAEREVVVEAVLHRRADAVPGVGIELHHRGGEQVGSRVPKDVERVFARLVIAVIGHEAVSI